MVHKLQTTTFFDAIFEVDWDNNIRRGTLPDSGVYLNNFPLIICFTPGPLYVVDMTFKAFQKASNCLLLDSVFHLHSIIDAMTEGPWCSLILACLQVTFVGPGIFVMPLQNWVVKILIRHGIKLPFSCEKKG